MKNNHNNVKEGIPIAISLNFSAVPSTDVSITRATGSDLSELSDIIICVFHGDGSFEQIVTSYEGGGLTKGGNSVSQNGERRYSVSFKSTSGEKKLIAVANVADGAYWENLITELTEAFTQEKHFIEVKNIIAEINQNLVDQAGSEDGIQPFHITAPSQMFISGWNEGIIFGTNNTITNYGKYGDQSNDIAIKMKRAMAHITFNIAANPDNAKGIFTPSSFRVYNIPTKSYLTNDLQDTQSYALTDNIENVQFIHTASEKIDTPQGENYSFNFYMPENIQQTGKSTSYNERDEWTGSSGATSENKTWTKAPQNSTFVVISGTYEGEATVGTETGDVTANVEYTIHLGDFGESNDSQRDFTDFSVMRNYSYIYNVQILGVDNIIVEAQKKGGEQQGAEGSVYDNNHTEYSYNLDAHYEQVYLEYNLSEIAANLDPNLTGEDLDNAIANQLILIIQSEAMDYNKEEEGKYSTRNKRGSLWPYKIYADAKRNQQNIEQAKKDILDGIKGETTPTKGFDYKWIEFLPQKDPGISEYPGVSLWSRADVSDLNNGAEQVYGTTNEHVTEDSKNLMDAYDIIVAMGNVVKKIYNKEEPSLNEFDEGGVLDQDFFTGKGITVSQSGNNYVARFTAFVDEYYYYKHPLTGAPVTTWSVFTNKIPREMIISMSTDISDDGNSSYNKVYSYITQLSMQTFYNSRAINLNGFGIETYNEMPLTFTFGNPTLPSNATLDDSDGRTNQIYLLGRTSNDNNYGRWDTYLNLNKNGWTKTLGSTISSHKLDGINGGDAYKMEQAYYACLSRNRDLNGDGIINPNEIRWYLASLNEYIRMGIGSNAISSTAKLYHGVKNDMDIYGYPSSYIQYGSLYFTSSASDKRCYWAVEKGSYSSISSSYGTQLPIRCIRILPAINDQQDISNLQNIITASTYEKINATQTEPIVLKFKDRLVDDLYRVRAQGNLSIHNEDQPVNSFYEGIFVAEDYLKDERNNKKRYKLGDIIGYNNERRSYVTYFSGEMLNPCATYKEKGYKNWRVPNLVELSAMNAAGLLEGSDNTTDGDACCTQFSNLNVRYGFIRSTLITCPGGYDNHINRTYYIRCVRDVPNNYFDNQ